MFFFLEELVLNLRLRSREKEIVSIQSALAPWCFIQINSFDSTDSIAVVVTIKPKLAKCAKLNA